ncbi:hypothetical protein O6H91_12G002100 [Diphasiastrum complanatum]|uniref:Uncharacterized protein n=2 Tax=Diphasiastrum complanatum TaxID=34168 RepID=A0ACC2BYC3_DIPCM|nr:hypothetical protein O6H91_12G001900 [Diphasiastrum complanatum]KAJ7534748.1 hypothetical protein O6H91_12G002100 [Diphasiastrum complanatum]
MEPEYSISLNFNFGIWNFILSLFGLHNTPSIASSARLKKEIDQAWTAQISLFVMLVLNFLHIPLLVLGAFVETYLNTVNANGGVTNIILLVLTFRVKDIVRPKPESSSFYSVTGHLDWRTTLDRDIALHRGKELNGMTLNFFTDKSLFEDAPEAASEAVMMAEICMMSSKLAYENAAVIKKIITDAWNMNFVAQYDCWNECQRQKLTKVFIATDKAQNADVIVVAFRGTEPFNTLNYITDIDFSWYKFQALGQVHVGFLEALGLGDRNNLETLAELQRRLLEPGEDGRPTSGLLPHTTQDATKPLAYDVVTQQLKVLLSSHKNAKIYVTGHSLGGAMACLYSTLLHYKKEEGLTSKLGGVYTFGQPRVGDGQFCEFVIEKLTRPVNRYIRVVYNSDIIPRVPFDLNPILKFKHAGIARFFNPNYAGELLEEVPNKNYFSPCYFIPMEISAIWEIIYNRFFLSWMYGDEFRESKTSLLFRICGLFFPGLGSHSPVNYVNSVRLGISRSEDTLW